MAWNPVRSVDATQVQHWIRRCPSALVLMIALSIRLATLGTYPLLDTTDARYAEMARKMVETGNWLTPQFDYGVPFWGKPPLSVWLTAASFQALGINEFAAHLPSFLIVLGLTALIAYVGRRQRGGEHAWRAAAIFATTASTFIAAGTVSMDPGLTLGVTLAMVGFWLAINGGGVLWGYLSFAGLALGLMAKGPIVLVLSGLPIAVWVLARRQWQACRQRLPLLAGTGLMLGLVVPWYLLAERATPGFLEYFLIGEHWRRFTEPGWAGDLYGYAHSRPLGSIWLDWVIAALPWSLLLLAAFARAVWSRRLSAVTTLRSRGWELYLVLWTISPMVFFSFSGNILWTYVFPGIPAFALLMAELWQNGSAAMSPRARSVGRATAALGLIIPVLFVGALFLVFSSFETMRTQKFLVGRYHELHPAPTSRLIYVADRPFSAEFYSNGKALKIGGIEQMRRMLANGREDFFAVPAGLAATLPEAMRPQLDQVGIFGRFTLLKAHPP